MTTYACKNAPRPRSGAIVRDGCKESGAVVAQSKWRGADGKKLEFWEIVPCQYTRDNPADKYCSGCSWQSHKSDVNSN
jgi:hypothetical protein